MLFKPEAAALGLCIPLSTGIAQGLPPFPGTPPPPPPPPKGGGGGGSGGAGGAPPLIPKEVMWKPWELCPKDEVLLETSGEWRDFVT